MQLKLVALEETSSSDLTRGYLICLTGTILWSTTGIFIRYLTETYQIPPLVLAFWRDFILAITLIAFFAVLNPRRLQVGRQNVRFLILYGLEVSLFNSLWTISVALNGAAVATVLVYSSAAFTAILSWRLFNEQLGIFKFFAVSLSLVGCVFISGAYDPGAWDVNPVGVITGLLSGLAFAGYSLMGKAAAQRKINPWTTLTYAFGFAVPFLLVYNLLSSWLPAGLASMELFWLGDSIVGWGILILLAVGPTIGGYGLYTVSLSYLPAGVANLIATLEPVMTSVLAFFLLGEVLSIPQLVGGGLILAGLLLLRWSEGSRPNSLRALFRFP